MHQELTIGDLDTTVDPAGTVEVSRISVAVVKAIIKAIADVIISTTNQSSSSGN